MGYVEIIGESVADENHKSHSEHAIKENNRYSFGIYFFLFFFGHRIVSRHQVVPFAVSDDCTEKHKY